MFRGTCCVFLLCALGVGCDRGNESTPADTPRRRIATDRLCTDSNAVGPPLKVGTLLATGGHARIAGTTSVGANVYINGVRAQVDSEGKFAAHIAKFAWSTTAVVSFDETGCTEWHFAEQVVTSAN